jgi:cyanophycinase
MEGFSVTEADMSDFTEDRPVTIRNISMHLLSSGDIYKIRQINPPHK